MTRTSYLPEAPHATGFSVHHYAGTLTAEPAHDAGAMAPAGQVWSTVEDLARYAAFLAAGDERVIAPATIAEMCIPQSGSRASALANAHGLGIALARGGSGMLVGHTGSMPGFLAGCFADPVRRTAAVVMANATVGHALRGSRGRPARDARGVRGHASRCRGARAATSRRRCSRSWACGTGATPRSPSRGTRSGSWCPTPSGAPSRTASCLQDDGTFLGTRGYHNGERLHVVRNDDGSINHLVCETFVYTRTPYDPDAPIPGGHPR